MRSQDHTRPFSAWITWLQRTVLVLMALLLFMPGVPVQADVGPKPSEKFSFVFTIPKVDIISGQLLQCDEPTCQAGKPLEKLGPQDFTCGLDSCRSLAYGYHEYQKLVVTFTDGVKESNVFTKKAFNATYTVMVLPDSLQVKETSAAGIPGCCPSLGLTLVLETLLASIYLSAFHLPRLILGWVPIASLVTLPFVWLVFPLLGLNEWLTTGLSETFAVLVEAAFLFVVIRRAIRLRHLAVLSLTMNAFSFLVGLVSVL